MFRIITLLLVLSIASTVMACDLSRWCPDSDELHDLNQLIAEYQAKLDFVQAGYKENRSGYPNKPAILEREIESLISTRDSVRLAIAKCNKQCVLDNDESQELPAACPECKDKEARYRQTLDNYVVKLAEVDSFKKQFRLENISDLDTAYTDLIAIQKKLERAMYQYRGLNDSGERKKFTDEVLRPIIAERDRLAKLVPNTGDHFNGPNTAPDAEAMLSALRLLEKQLDDANYARDKALDALIDCNLRRCGVSRNANALFMPGGLYGPATGRPGWNGVTQPEGLSGGNAEANATEVNRTEPSNDGALAEPNFASFIINDEVVIDVPTLPAKVQQQLAALTDNNDVHIPPKACELIPAQLCQYLDESSKSECVTRFTDNNRMCKQRQQQMLSGRPMAVCNGTCDYTEVLRIDGLWLLEQIYRSIDLRVESRLDSRDAVKKMSLRNQLRQLRVEQKNLQDIPETRKHLIYKNTQTGRRFEHFGLFFEPQPPLIYVGMERGERTQQENQRLQILPSSIFDLEKEITSVAIADTLLIDWADQAKSHWQRLMPCQREQIPAKVAICRSECSVVLGGRQDDYFWTPTFCSPAGVIGLLHNPSSKVWIYPPDK